MTDIGALHERLLAAASLKGPEAAVRIRATYEPIGGAYDKVSPPTYPIGDDKTPPYLLETRHGPHGEEETVVLDSRQSQANRCEEALQTAIDSGDLVLPHLVLRTQAHSRALRITSLEAPHRSRDAYFRDAETDEGVRFDETAVGQALKAVTPQDASALYRHAVTDLVYGVWDSHRKLRLAPRFPRVYTSETVGYGVVRGRRAAGRADLVVSGAEQVLETEDRSFTLPGEKAKGTKKLSELGHGSIPPSDVVTRNNQTVLAPGGVTVRLIQRTASIGFAGIARLTFGADWSAAATSAARAVIASLALAGDRLAFARPSVFYRSGCELLLLDEELAWVGSGSEEPLELEASDALALVARAVEHAEDSGVTWHPDPVELRPHAALQAVIEKSFFKVPGEEE